MEDVEKRIAKAYEEWVEEPIPDWVKNLSDKDKAEYADILDHTVEHSGEEGNLDRLNAWEAAHKPTTEDVNTATEETVADVGETNQTTATPVAETTSTTPSISSQKAIAAMKVLGMDAGLDAPALTKKLAAMVGKPANTSLAELSAAVDAMKDGTPMKRKATAMRNLAQYKSKVGTNENPGSDRSERGGGYAGVAFDTPELDDANARLEEDSARFDNELQRQIDGSLPKGHVYQLGRPGPILRSTGVPDLPIQLSAARLMEKSRYSRHPFGLADVKGLVRALRAPVAVFSYGDRAKAQNIIVEISSNGKNFLVGLSLNPEVGGRVLNVNSIRNVFPKDTAEWLHWIEQGKLLYADKQKVQVLIDQQRMTFADVKYLNLNRVNSILDSFVNPQVENSRDSDGNGVVSFDTPGLSAEDRRQYDEVVARYTNPDGTRKRGWMRAPNGKPTNLTERQWVQVRTPSFKRWFGDWEVSAEANRVYRFLMNTASVASITGNEFPKDGVKLTDKIPAFFKEKYNGVAFNEELGEIKLDIEGVKDDIAHGIGRLKVAAYAAVHDVIEKGIVYNRSENWKGRGWKTAVIGAPIKIGGADYICEVVIKQLPNRRGFYLHEVEVKENVEDTFKTSTKGGVPPTSRLIIAKLLNESKSTSKVVDENGEPLVVYHGTKRQFTKFIRGSHFGGNIEQALDRLGFYHDQTDFEETSLGELESRAIKDGGHIIRGYVNIKNPLVLDFDLGSWESKDFENRGISIEGHDGVIYDNWYEGRENEKNPAYIIFNPSQIKSATDNVGTFDPTNPDIRFDTPSLVTPADVKRHADLYARYKAGDKPAFKRGDRVFLKGAKDGQRVMFLKANADGTADVQVRTPGANRYMPEKIETRTVPMGDVSSTGMKDTLTDAERAELKAQFAERVRALQGGVNFDTPELDDANARLEEDSAHFDNELQRQIGGSLPKDHVYQLGRPGPILRSTGVPDLPIQLSAARLMEKSRYSRHPFGLADVKGLVRALRAPVAVFSYGDRAKAQNIIVEISSNGKNFLVGLSLNPEVGGRVLNVNSIRNVFPKDTAEWLHWIEQGKLLYADKQKVQAVIDQRRINLADVPYLDLNRVNSILDSFVNPQVENSRHRKSRVFYFSILRTLQAAPGVDVIPDRLHGNTGIRIAEYPQYAAFRIVFHPVRSDTPPGSAV